ncbi:MAG TPA: hypothetical protein VGH28_31600 [Polyangiaceae bacterium]
MSRLIGRRRALAELGALVALVRCDPLLPDFVPAPASLGTFPYHPLVFHLDLAILAYQLHGQSLVWPFDPFYEERTHGVGLARDAFMQKVASWVTQQAAAQAGVTSLGTYRGPGALGGFPNNPTHDPILYDYSLIHPWSHAVMNADAQWTEYLTPDAITSRIEDVYVSYRKAGGAESDVVIDPVPLGRDDRTAGATDVLIAFEGGTGDKGEPGQPASQSLMGCALMRRTTEGYDVHVAFRGSRSGDAIRAATSALSTEEASGNPDWITDLGSKLVSAADGVGDITAIGSVCRGFSRSMESMLPAVFLALEKISELAGGAPPRNVFVTGHSLGAALAQHFTSAILLGDSPVPAALSAWPWQTIKLITFAAPRAGDTQWAQTLTEDRLQSDFYNQPLLPYDPDARYVTDPEIVARLFDESRPAAFRVLISNDPVTADVFGGAHVGKTVYVNGDLPTDWAAPPSFASHEPVNIRKYMTDAMADPRTPAVAWRYRALEELAPTYDASQAGSDADFAKLGDGVVQYYASSDEWLDVDAFTSHFDLMTSIENA